jgi:hypothetical protein
MLDNGEAAKEISDVHLSLLDHLQDLSAYPSLNKGKFRIIASEKRMQVSQLQLI